MWLSGGICVQQSFVVSVDDGFKVGDTTIRKFEGFSFEHFVVGVVKAKVLIYDFDDLGTNFVLDGLVKCGGGGL